MAKIKWTSDVIVFVDALFKFLTYLQIEKQPLLLHQPSSFRTLNINKRLLSEAPINTVFEVHYDKRSNKLVCEVADLLGVTFKSTPFKNKGSLIWKELKFQPYFDTCVTLKDFFSTSLELTKESDLGTWMEKSSSPNLLMVRPKNDEKLTTHQYLKKLVLDYFQLYEKVLEEDVDKAIKRVRSSEQQKYLIVGDQATVAKLAEFTSSDRFYCITITKCPQTCNPLLKPILFYNDERGKLTLLKKINNESPVVVMLDGKGWQDGLRRSLKDYNRSHPLVLVFRNLVPRHVLPILAADPFIPSVRTVFIQQNNAPQFSTKSPTFASQLLLSLPVNVLLDGVWGSLRTVNIGVDANDSLSYITRNINGMSISYIGLNPHAVGKNTNVPLVLGCVDYSGSTGEDQGVMGVAQFQADSKRLNLDPVLRWPVPKDWTLQDAASVPVAYGLAYYCIHLKAKVKAGEKVLVLPGDTPLGQAIICMAFNAGANVITCVSNKEEFKVLKEKYPKLDPSHIIIKSLEDLGIPVRKLTEGKGVDVVVSSLRGRDMHSTVQLMDMTSCRYLYLGHTNLEDRESIGMRAFFLNSSLHGISVENLTRCCEVEKREIHQAVLDGIMKKEVKPLKTKTFSCRSQSEVVEFLDSNSLSEKTTIRLEEESSTTKDLYFDPEEFVIIAGTTSNFWLEVAAWVINNGGRHLIVLTTENMIAASNFHKVDKIISHLQGTLTFYPLSRFDSIEDGFEMLEELVKMRPIHSLLCLNMDESSERYRNLDFASRKAVPGLHHFISLLGEGAGVCESRASFNLPVCCVQRSASLLNPAKLLPYLTKLVSTTSRFYMVEDTSKKPMKSVASTSLSVVQSHLPHNVAELELLAANMSETLLQEVPSLSPRYEYVKHQLLPLFVIPGISSGRIEHLTQHLMHPVFCPTMPPSEPTIEQSATALFKQISHIQKEGPYNIIAETWSGITALHLASLLEAQGHRVVVFLLDASPSALQTWARIFRRPTGLFTSEHFLSVILGSHRNVSKDFDDLSPWDEQLDKSLHHLESTQETHQVPVDCIKKYLSTLKTHLTNIMDYKPQRLHIKATVHLIQSKEPSDSDLHELTQSCQQRPVLHLVEDDGFTNITENPKTAVIINENASFSWKV